MAGFDIRWNSPIGNLPYAIYGQYIGEDESSYHAREVPEAAWCSRSGSRWRTAGWCRHSSNTRPLPARPTPTAGPTTTAPTTRAGSTSRDIDTTAASIGYTADRDAENWALGASYAAADGTLWTATARASRLNRDDFGDTLNTVASVPTDYDALELGWKGRLFGEQLSVDLGVEAIEPVERRAGQSSRSDSSAGDTNSSREPARQAGTLGLRVRVSHHDDGTRRSRGWRRATKASAQRHPVAGRRRHPARPRHDLAHVLARYRA